MTCNFILNHRNEKQRKRQKKTEPTKKIIFFPQLGNIKNDHRTGSNKLKKPKPYYLV